MADEDQNGSKEKRPSGEASPREEVADAADDDQTAICPTCDGSGLVHVEHAQPDQPTIIVWGEGFSAVEDAPTVSMEQWIMEFNQDPDAPKAS